jgi:hypothetical protein
MGGDRIERRIGKDELIKDGGVVDSGESAMVGFGNKRTESENSMFFRFIFEGENGLGQSQSMEKRKSDFVIEGKMDN